jgi:hypothetical protein
MAEQKVVLEIDARGETGGIMQFIAGLKRLKESANQSDSAFAGLANRFKGFLAPLISAVSLGAITKFTKDSIDNADALSKQAQKAGMAVEAFSALAYAAKLSDASAEDLITATKGLSAWLEKTGQVGRDLTEVMIEQSDVFARMADGPEKVRIAQERFGRSGQQLIPLLNQGSAALREQMEEAKQFGAVVGPRFAANAQQFNDNLTRFWTLLRGIGNMIADAVLPEFIKLQEGVLDWIKGTGAHIAAVDSLIQVYQGFALMVASVRTGLEQVLGTPAAFFGNLSVTGSVKEAWKAASEQAESEFHRFEKRLDQIVNMSRKTPDERGGSTPSGIDTKAKFDADQKEAELAVKKLQYESQLLRVRGYVVEVTNEAGETEKRIIGSLQQESELLKQNLDDQYEILSAKRSAAREAGESGLIEEREAIEQILAINQELLRVRKESFDLKEKTNDFTFFEKLTRNLDDMTDKFAHFGASIADILTNGIGRAIDTVADGLWAVIDGTATWGELFLQVGRSIISDLIRMALQEVLLAGLKKTLATGWKAFTSTMRAADVTEANAAEAAKTPALVANATLSSIASWGIAVAIGVAAIAGILASVGAFRDGGVVDGGEQLIRVNEGGVQEAVLNGRATAMLGRDRIASLNSGDFAALNLENRMASNFDSATRVVQPMYQAPSSPQSQSQSITVVLVVKDSVQGAQEFLTSAGGRGLILNAVKDGKYEIGLPPSQS